MAFVLEFYILLTYLGARFDDGAGGDNEVQRTMLELINQLDGFDPRGNIKVLMATNRSVLSWKWQTYRTINESIIASSTHSGFQ